MAFSHPRIGPRGRPLTLTLAALIVLIASLVSPVSTGVARAQGGDTTAPTTAPATSPTTAPTTAPPTAPTTAPETTGGANPTVPSTSDTTAPASSGDTGSTAGDPTTTTVADDTTPSTNEDGTPIIDEDDPGSFEESFEEPPDTDATVPPPEDDGGRYAGQGEYEPDKVLISSVRQARAKLAQAEEDHLLAISIVKTLRLRLKRLEFERQALDEETQENLEAIELAENRLRARALSAFVRGGTIEPENALDPDEALEFQAQQTIADAVFEGDDELIAAFHETREELDQDVLSLFDRTWIVADALADGASDVDDRAADVEQAARELEAFEAGSQIYIKGVVFPVAWPYEVPLINSWGFPRMTGSVDEHWHEGIDIFAPSGTPLLAAERGVLTRIGSGRLGGLRLWLRGESGTDWYYAHLSDFAPGLREGMVVEAGDVIGYVGNTGNAVGTPPHLHMQVHPNGGDPVNPYPLLYVVSQNERAEAEAAEELE